MKPSYLYAIVFSFLLISCGKTNESQEAEEGGKQSSQNVSGSEFLNPIACEKKKEAFDYQATDLYRDAVVIKAVRYSEEQITQRAMQDIESLEESILEEDFDYELGEKMVQLNAGQKDHLFEITTGYTEALISTGADCYDPGYLLVFEDAEGRSLGLIEICFACSRLKANHPLLAWKCNDQFYDYQALFKEIGLQE